MSKAQAARPAAAQLVRLVVPAGKATPSPPVGPALGQRGVKAIDFCKQFNDRTKDVTPGVPIPVRLTINPDRSFSFITKTPQTSWFLKQAAGIEKGSSRNKEDIVGEVSLKHVYEIAKMKQTDPGMDDLPLEGIARSVVGQAKSMGIRIVP